MSNLQITFSKLRKSIKEGNDSTLIHNQLLLLDEIMSFHKKYYVANGLYQKTRESKKLLEEHFYNYRKENRKMRQGYKQLARMKIF